MFSEAFTAKTDWRNEVLSNEKITEDRVCHILKTQLYYMADNENQDVYEPLQLKLVFPINSTQGISSVLNNTIFLLGYVQENGCNRDTIDQIIENDIHPIIGDLRNEYDFILASVIMVACKEKSDFSDKNKMMKYMGEVLGKFLYALEYFQESILFAKEDVNLSLEDGVKRLSKGMVIKNYPELCRILCQVSYKTGSNSQKAQLKEFARYFKWEKHGQKYIVLEIYDEPLPKQDKRKNGNNTIYVTYIEAILLKYLSCKKDFTCYLTKNQLFYLLGMINGYYKRITLDELELIDTRITKWELDNFYFRCNRKLNDILTSALRSLENRSLISSTEQHVIVTNRNEYYTANDYEIKRILNAEKIILEKMGMYSKSHVACCYKMGEFYTLLNEYVSEHYGWDHTFRRYKIVSNKEFLQQGIEENEIKLQRLLNNERIIEAINKNALKEVDKQKNKLEVAYQMAMEEWVRSENYFDKPTKKKVKEENNIYTYPQIYVEVQNILSSKLLKIDDGEYKRRHKYIPVRKFDLSQEGITELDVLFSNTEEG